MKKDDEFCFGMWASDMKWMVWSFVHIDIYIAKDLFECKWNHWEEGIKEENLKNNWVWNRILLESSVMQAETIMKDAGENSGKNSVTEVRKKEFQRSDQNLKIQGKGKWYFNYWDMLTLQHRLLFTSVSSLHEGWMRKWRNGDKFLLSCCMQLDWEKAGWRVLICLKIREIVHVCVLRKNGTICKEEFEKWEDMD